MEIVLQDLEGNEIESFEISDEIFHELEVIAAENNETVEETIHRALTEQLQRLLDNEQNPT